MSHDDRSTCNLHCLWPLSYKKSVSSGPATSSKPERFITHDLSQSGLKRNRINGDDVVNGAKTREAGRLGPMPVGEHLDLARHFPELRLLTSPYSVLVVAAQSEHSKKRDHDD